jgi:hypothetical protein
MTQVPNKFFEFWEGSSAKGRLSHPDKIDWKLVDKEMIPIIKTINKTGYVWTFASCQGHLYKKDKATPFGYLGLIYKEKDMQKVMKPILNLLAMEDGFYINSSDLDTPEGWAKIFIHYSLNSTRQPSVKQCAAIRKKIINRFIVLSNDF